MPDIVGMVQCRARVEAFEIAEPELIPASWCKECPDCVEFKPEICVPNRAFEFLGLGYARAPVVICRHDPEKEAPR